MSSLDPLRSRLDEVDDEVVRLLGERFEICREVAAVKRINGIAMMQPERVAGVRERYRARGAEVGLAPDFTEKLFELLIAATCEMEDALIGAAAERPCGHPGTGGDR
jgi:4-amino-4-deoxychorismate mutase